MIQLLYIYITKYQIGYKATQFFLREIRTTRLTNTIKNNIHNDV